MYIPFFSQDANPIILSNNINKEINPEDVISLYFRGSDLNSANFLKNQGYEQDFEEGGMALTHDYKIAFIPLDLLRTLINESERSVVKMIVMDYYQGKQQINSYLNSLAMSN